MNLVRKFLNGITAATVSIVVVVTATAAVALGTTTPSQLPFVGSSSDSTSTTSTSPDDPSTDATSTTLSDDSSTSSTLKSGSSDTSSTSSTSSTSTSTTLAEMPSDTASHEVMVIDAGVVSYAVDGAELLVVDVSPNDGWTPTVEVAVGREVEVTFRSGNDRVDLNLELEHNQVRIRIRDRRTGVRTEVFVPVGDPQSTTSIDPSNSSGTSTSTVPDTDTTTAPATQHSIQASGGTVVVSVSGDTVLLVSAVPTTGYSVDVRDAGPSTVEVRFESGDAESRVKVRVDKGQLRKSVEDR